MFVKLQEEPLVPPVVFGKTADHFPVPIVDRADRPQLPAHIFDIGHRPFKGMNPPADGGVFRRQAEGVEAYGMQNVVALHTPEASVAVRRGHRVPVPDVKIARRVGVHGHLKPLGPGVAVGHPVEPVLFPAGLPFLVYLHRIVAQFGLSRAGRHLLSPRVGLE